MSQIFITGDTHGDFKRFSSKNFSEGKDLTKDDYVIILGDFGLLWENNYSPKEQYWTNWLSEKPWTTLFLDGNHENFNRLDKLPTINMFNDEVGKVSNSIYHLKRGRVYTIDDKAFFTMGGGFSIDKQYRTENISWWAREMPSKEEYDLGFKSLKENKVDYVLTHTCSNKIFRKLAEVISINEKIKGEEGLRDFLEYIYLNVKYKHWYFGHFHYDLGIDKHHTVLYNNIKEL